MRTDATETAEGPLSRPYLEVTLAVLALVTIVAFESMAVSTAMPAVARELDAVRSYGFAFSVMLTAQLLGIVLAGVWSDRSGPLPGAVVGQVLLAAGAATCGSATRLDVFLVGRALTGLGGGLLVVMLYVIAGRVYPEGMRPRLFTYISAAWVVPSLAGPPLSAWLTENLSWRWVFWGVVAPVVVTVFALSHAQRRVDTSGLREAVSGRDHRAHVRAAWAGLGVALAAGALQYGTHELVFAWSPKTVVALVGLAGVVAVAPVLLPRATWVMGAGLPSVILSRALLCAAFYGGITYVPLFLAGQRGASLQVAGLALAVGAVGWAVGAWYQGHDALHLPRYRLVEVGGLVLTFGLIWLSVVAWANLPAWLSVLALLLAGLSMGAGVTTTTILALELSPLEEHGEASSSIQLADVLGSVLGIAGATAAFAAAHDPGQDNALFGAIFLGLALVAAVVVPAGQRIRT
ncbi:MFS transporter [Phycicoccus sonneratiae]|uniref:MFS transporter n=1 Tax=Phycicoccus sonneratiae TaxID=2807628 RepID=A0ABS2CGT4_9MICO|nr:MFS transporter [Phycicoccus sonneraticus]MBM6399082.1 MFS transporter [Phycicoccus sonneraticus]